MRRGEGNLHGGDSVRDRANEHAPVVGGDADAVTASPRVSRHSRSGRTELVGARAPGARPRTGAEHVLSELHQHLPDAPVAETDEHAVPPLVQRERRRRNPGLTGRMPVTTEPCAGPQQTEPDGMLHSRTPVPRHRHRELRSLRVPRGAVALARVLRDGVVGPELFSGRGAGVGTHRPRPRRAIRRRGDDPGGRAAAKVDGAEARADVNLGIAAQHTSYTLLPWPANAVVH